MGMILFFLILLFLWQGTYWIGVDVLEIFKSYSVPSPLGVGRCFLELMQDGSLLQATLNSLFRGIPAMQSPFLLVWHWGCLFIISNICKET